MCVKPDQLFSRKLLVVLGAHLHKGGITLLVCLLL